MPRDSFNYITNYSWAGDFPDEMESSSNGVPRRTIKLKRQNKKIQPIYEYFYKQVESFDSIRLSRFLKSLYNSYIVRIDIQNPEEAFAIFERTNARGVDLAASDLLKNYLFSKGQEGLEEKWQLITTNSENNILRMLKYFYVSRRGSVSKSDLYKKIKNYGVSIGIESLVEEISEFSNYYSIIQKSEESKFRDFLDEFGCRHIAGDEDKYPRIF